MESRQLNELKFTALARRLYHMSACARLRLVHFARLAFTWRTVCKIDRPSAVIVRSFSWYLSCSIAEWIATICRSSWPVDFCGDPTTEPHALNPRFWRRRAYDPTSEWPCRTVAATQATPSEIATNECVHCFGGRCPALWSRRLAWQPRHWHRLARFWFASGADDRRPLPRTRRRPSATNWLWRPLSARTAESSALVRLARLFEVCRSGTVHRQQRKKTSKQRDNKCH